MNGTAPSCMQVVPGSHARGTLETRQWKDAPPNTISQSIPVPIEWLGTSRRGTYCPSARQFAASIGFPV
jgi:hypothetical protein